VRRFAVIVIASALALLAAPAGAGMDVTVAPRHAADGASDAEARLWTPRPSSIVTANWNVTVDGQASSSLKEFRVSVVSDEQQIPPLAGTASVVKTYSLNTKTADTIQIPWDSTVLTPYNGNYRIVSFASSHATNSETNTILGLKVNNPPATPSGVRAVIEEDDSVITWKANPEPDITGYVVYRSADDAAFKQIGLAGSTRYKDADISKGVSLRYQVAAVRRSVVSPGGVTSPATKPTPPIAKLDPGGGAQPGEIQAQVPETLPELPPTIIKAPQRDLGFAPGLPFGQPIPARAIAAAAQAEDQLISTPTLAIRNTVYKPPFIAAALLMLVISLHLLRVGRLLWVGPGEAAAFHPPAGPRAGGRSPLVWVRSLTTNLIGFPWKSNSSRNLLSKNRSQGTAGRPVANKTKVGGATEA